MKLVNVLRDFSAPAAWAGLTAFVWYAFGAVPLQIAVADQLGLTAAQSSSWIFIVWFGGAVSSIALSLYFKLPIPITWTIPGLVFLGSIAGQFTFAEIIGANLVAGILILILGMLGVGGRLMAWLPLPIIMGMFAGTMLGYMNRLVSSTVEDFMIAGPTVAGYIIGKLINNRRVPPVGLAVVIGGLSILLTQQASPVPMSWSLPTPAVAEMTFSLSAITAISLPLVVLALGMGNVQGLGFLSAQGYRVPVNRVSVVVGINSVVNAFFGGHAATVGRAGSAIVAGPDAGPVEKRYWANIVAASLTVLIAVAAGTITSLLTVLPTSYILTLAGLAIFASLQDAFQKAFGGQLRFGALVAFAVATTPFSFMGITSAFWALVVGTAASWLLERGEISDYGQQQKNGTILPAIPVPALQPSQDAK